MNYITGILGFLLALAVMAVVLMFPIMWTWNYTMPVIFGFPEIDVWQALWMGVLARFLFGTGGKTS